MEDSKLATQLILESIKEVSADVKQLSIQMNQMNERIFKIENKLTETEASVMHNSEIRSKMEQRISEAHKRIDDIEASPLMKANNLVMQVIKSGLLILSGAIAILILNRLLPELMGK